jgi:uncharacterized Tic20 family protein
MSHKDWQIIRLSKGDSFWAHKVYFGIRFDIISRRSLNYNGNRKIMNDKNISEESSFEEKFMSLLSHLSILIPNIGIIAPIIIFVTQKDKSRFVKFHSIQAIFFQLILMVVMMASIFTGIILMIVSIPWTAMDSQPGTLFFVSMIIMFLYFPLWLVFGVYAVVAAVKSFKSELFKYVLIGKIVKRKIYS